MMFSANTPSLLPVTSFRNPRRRQRTNSDESAKLPRAKRQRSTLRQHSGETSSSSRFVDDLCSGELLNPKAAGQGSPTSSVILGDLALRGPRKLEKKNGRVDGITFLSNNDYYTISHLLPLPDLIKEHAAVSFRCILSSENGYSLALTQAAAMIWPHSSLPSFTANDVLTLSIPNPSTHAKGALPLGAFVPKSASVDPGLIVVVPSTGKITFWETISKASIVRLTKQRQNGIQGSIPGMLSGEAATSIINAEPSGIIITLSTGRLAHVSIRDPQGKPVVSVQLLRGVMQAPRNGIFGSLRNVLAGNSQKRNIAAARAGASHQRGQRDVIIATSSGTFELWDTHWSNGSTLKKQTDVNGNIWRALVGTGLLVEDSQNTIELLDFAFNQADVDLTDQSLSLWVLICVSQCASVTYYVAGLTILASDANVGNVITLDYHESLSGPNHTYSPRLYVPSPGGSAFVVFCDAVVLLSVTHFNGPPSTQLLADSDSVPAPFQDCIRFRRTDQCSILECAVEDPDDDYNHPSCLLMIQNFGLIRISALPLQFSENGVEYARVNAKARLEQAVFYGNMKNNPVEFLGYDELNSSPIELEKAALEISDEILRSSSRFIPTAVPLEQQMQLRATALEDLAVCLKRYHNHLSSLTRWSLLWGAEKMAAQRAIWEVQEGIKKRKVDNQTHLGQILGQMGERFKTKLGNAKNEMDQTRQWFIHDTWRMEHIIPWILNGIRDIHRNTSRVGRSFAEQLYEASELSLATLETAFQFRERNAPLYGVDNVHDNSEVFASQYPDLPEFWTSRSISYAETEHLLDLELNTCIQWMRQKIPKTGSPDSLTHKIIRKIEQNIPRQFNSFAQIHAERIRWTLAQDGMELRNEGRALQVSHLQRRKTQLFKMAAVGLLEDAISLAEKLQDMEALVELMVDMQDQIKQSRIRQALSREDLEASDDEMKRWSRRIDKYFERFGETWAESFFGRQISVGQPGMLLIMREYQPHVTRFLRKRPCFLKLSWINDVVGEQDYNTASRALHHLAAHQESDLWSKRVELSLGKLAGLADLEKSGVNGMHEVQDEIKHFDAEYELSSIQEMLYEHIVPALHGAIDQRAEFQLVSEQFGRSIVHGKPAFREILRRGLRKLVARNPVGPDELINVLTLMDPVQFLEGGDDEVVGHEFVLALRVLKLGDFDKRDRDYYEMLEKVIWRRCMIRDNWETINETGQKGIQEVECEIRGTALFRTLAECMKGFDHDTGLPYQHYTPSDILNSDCVVDKLGFQLLPEEHDHLSQDLRTETEILRTYVEKARLNIWFSWIKNVLKVN